MPNVNVWDGIAKRYPTPEYAVFYEVSSSTGGGANARADALVMSLWPSRGLEMIGIEVKVSRGDWLREKKDPLKSSHIQRFCDRWYLAIDDAEIVKDGELPTTWGLLGPKGGKVVELVKAPKLEPEQMSRAFIASILRNADTNQQKSASRIAEARIAALQADMKQRIADETQHVKQNAEWDRKRAEEASRTLNEWSTITHLSLHQVQQRGLGQLLAPALQAVLDAETGKHLAQLENTARALAEVQRSIEHQVKALQQAALVPKQEGAA